MKVKTRGAYIPATLVLGTLLITAFPCAFAQQGSVITSVPALEIKDPATIDYILSAALIPVDTVDQLIIYDLLRDGFGEGDVVVVLPERSVHVIAMLPEDALAYLRQAQIGNVLVTVSQGISDLPDSPAGSLAQNIDNLIRLQYEGEMLGATLEWHPNFMQIAMWGDRIEDIRAVSWEEISGAGTLLPVTFRRPPRGTINVLRYTDGTECREIITAEKNRIVRRCNIL